MNLKSSFLTTIFIVSSMLFGFSQNLSFIIETTEFKEGKEKTKEINMIYFGMKDHLVVMQPLESDEEMRILFNKNEKTMTFLNTEDMSGMKMKMHEAGNHEYDYDTYETTVEEAPDFKKTGKTMTIHNYKCYEFTATKDGETVEMWMTTDLPIAYYQLFDFYGSGSSPMMKQKKSKSSDYYLPYEFRKYGFPLKTIVKDEKGNVTILKFKAVSKSVDSNKLSTDGYNVQDMSTMPFMNNYMNR